MRKLASVRRVDSVRAVSNADSLDVIRIGGWETVCRRGEFREGDLVVYFEIDSFLPELEAFEYLRKSCARTLDGVGGFRLRTVTLRGQLSQGLAISIYAAHVALTELGAEASFEEGRDLTEALRVRLYDLSPKASVGVKGPFPTWIPKTDEPRVQNFSDSRYAALGGPLYVTEKLDGSSLTAYLREGVFGVCSRNFELRLEDAGSPHVRCAQHLRLGERLQRLGRNIAIQGELLGPGVQKNIYAQTTYSLHIFSAFDIDAQAYIGFEDLKRLAADLGLPMVPIITEDLWLDGVSRGELLARAEGESQLCRGVEREGLVIRSHDLGVSFKVISNKFLLKRG
jgi:RNA ligase (TIGR02306 family)